eukprot:jgi/Mesen1/1351/ME000013S00846
MHLLLPKPAAALVQNAQPALSGQWLRSTLREFEEFDGGEVESPQSEKGHTSSSGSPPAVYGFRRPTRPTETLASSSRVVDSVQLQARSTCGEVPCLEKAARKRRRRRRAHSREHLVSFDFGSPVTSPSKYKVQRWRKGDESLAKAGVSVVAPDSFLLQEKPEVLEGEQKGERGAELQAEEDEKHQLRTDGVRMLEDMVLGQLHLEESVQPGSRGGAGVRGGFASHVGSEEPLRERVGFLVGLGVDVHKVLQSAPQILRHPLAEVRARVAFLQSLGVTKTLGLILTLAPEILDMSIEGPEEEEGGSNSRSSSSGSSSGSSGSLRAHVRFLEEEVGIARERLPRVVLRCPRLLTLGIDAHLRPTLEFLRLLGLRHMGKAVANNPALLACDVEGKLKPKLAFLQGLGIDEADVASMAGRFPCLFVYSAETNLRPKLEYLVNEMGGSLRDVVRFPQYFGFSLQGRIRPRHEALAARGLGLRGSGSCGGVQLASFLTLSEAEFALTYLTLRTAGVTAGAGTAAGWQDGAAGPAALDMGDVVRAAGGDAGDGGAMAAGVEDTRHRLGEEDHRGDVRAGEGGELPARVHVGGAASLPPAAAPAAPAAAAGPAAAAAVGEAQLESGLGEKGRTEEEAGRS